MLPPIRKPNGKEKGKLQIDESVVVDFASYREGNAGYFVVSYCVGETEKKGNVKSMLPSILIFVARHQTLQWSVEPLRKRLASPMG